MIVSKAISEESIFSTHFAFTRQTNSPTSLSRSFPRPELSIGRGIVLLAEGDVETVQRRVSPERVRHRF